jgi:hypothetical protein
LRAPTPPRDQDARPGQRDDGLEASSATRIMAKSAASSVTGRRQIPIPIGIPMHVHDGAAPGPIALVQTMHVSEMHQQMPAPSPQISAPSQHDLKIIIDPLAATEMQNHQLQLQLAQTVHAMDQIRQFGSITVGLYAVPDSPYGTSSKLSQVRALVSSLSPLSAAKLSCKEALMWRAKLITLHGGYSERPRISTAPLGGTAVTAPPFFDTAGRTNVLFWHPVPTVTTCDLAGDPLVMALADFTDKEFEENYAPYLQQRHNWVILTPPLPKGLRRKLFLTVMGVRYRRDRVRSSRKGDGGNLASTNWPTMPPCSRDGWPNGRPLTRNSALSSRECCRIRIHSFNLRY